MDEIISLICVTRDPKQTHLTYGKIYEAEISLHFKSMYITDDRGIKWTYKYPNVKFKSITLERNKVIDKILK